MTPVVAVVDEDTYNKFLPLIESLAERLEATASDLVNAMMGLNGWTYDQIAWGIILRAIAPDDLEIIISDGTEVTTHTLND